MKEAPEQDYRVARLQDLLDDAHFAGIKTALGRALGYDNGAFIRQMLERERPISEKTVRAVETMLGGKYKGWFSCPATAPTFSARALRLARMYDELPPFKRQAAYASVQALHNPEPDNITTDDEQEQLPAQPTSQPGSFQ